MKNNQILKHINSLTSYLLIFLFTYTGVSKLTDHSSFEASLLQSPAIRSYNKIISWILPLSEMLIVALLLFKKLRQKGLWLSLLLLSTFTIYIIYMLLFVPNLPCSCGGILKELSWGGHIMFNSFFIIIILISLFPNNVNKLFIAINRKSRKPV